MRYLLLVLAIFLVTSCNYRGFVTRAEYNHNHFIPRHGDAITNDLVMGVVGPKMTFGDPESTPPVEFSMLVGPQIMEADNTVDDDAHGAIVINPRFFWWFAKESFFQVELDYSFIDDGTENAFVFVALEKLW